MLNLGWEMSVIRIFEWHYLYKFPEYFKYKDQFPACSTWAWTKGRAAGDGGPNPCPQDAYRPSFSQVSAIFLLLLTSLPANILCMLMISEDLLTFLFLILFPFIGFNHLLYVIVALNFISCYLWFIYHIPVPWVQVLTQVHLVISVSPHT